MTKAVEKNNSTIITEEDMNNIRHCLAMVRHKISEVTTLLYNVHPQYNNVQSEEYNRILNDSFDDVGDKIHLSVIWLEQAQQKINRNI
jgi:hypothetical protein